MPVPISAGMLNAIRDGGDAQSPRDGRESRSPLGSDTAGGRGTARREREAAKSAGFPHPDAAEFGGWWQDPVNGPIWEISVCRVFQSPLCPSCLGGGR